ncbi:MULTISPECIES: hypothetical protein [unclassified Acidiphilium]|uniref:portal protein n=1 Tax=unclassified Acidiphilium TaxID=2617493 RepID=UPI000BD925CE|nr:MULTISPECIES: hypothetical protein [unclassified Acidiphilium]OYV54522.1 MAG: hypothetical protein B7Z76_14195 [Acidiphilium sp. 20-67-58]HQT62529.1 hypothetical protein [Acidiphilium sp.]
MSQSTAPVSGLAPLAQVAGTAENVNVSMKRNGTLSLVAPDGMTAINIVPPGAVSDDEPASTFDENLAETIDDFVLAGMATQLVSDIEADEQSRAGWIDEFTEGLRLLGLRMQESRGDAGASTAPLEGMSTVVAPLLLDEVLRAQSTARGELLPADGPVRVVDESTGSGPGRDELADALQKDMNTYLTRVCSEYYPDTDRMLFYAVFCGSGFKKVYRCPIRQRPLSESVDAKDLIVNAGTTDLANAHRITHVIQMRRSDVRRMQLVGAYRDVALGAPMQQARPVEQAQAEISGIDAISQQPNDQNHTIYEVLTEWDLGEGPDGLPLPYKITIDKDSRTVLEVRRNWREGDELFRAREMYVRYPFIDAISFYGLGLLHLLGNTSKALTAAMRILIDAGMFSNFPGFLISDAGARQDTNELRVPPGGGRKVNTNGRPIRESVMELPYKGPSPVMMQLIDALRNDAKAMAGSAEMPVGDGRAPVPVGTMLAIVEQASKPMSAVHKRMHAAQAKEFQLLVDLLREDPEAFWRDGRRGIYQWDKETFIQALDAFELAPVSDPNSPTRTHRLLKAQALKMLQQGDPGMYDAEAVDGHILRLLGFSNPAEFFNHAQAPTTNPEAELAQAKIAEGQAKIAQQARDSELRLVEAKMRAESDQRSAQVKLATEAEKSRIERERLGVEAAAEGIKGAHQHARDEQAAAVPDVPDVGAPTPPGMTF